MIRIGRWAAKEAVLKAICDCSSSSKISFQYTHTVNATLNTSLLRGSCAPLKEVEICKSVTGSPIVLLHGTAAELAVREEVGHIRVSISHCEEYSTATAIAIGKKSTLAPNLSHIPQRKIKRTE